MQDGDLFLMSPPGVDWALRGRANFRSREATAVRPLAARKEWLRLAEAIEERGGTVVVLPPDPVSTGLPYAAEAGHLLPPRDGKGPTHRFLLPRMKAPHRTRERELWAPLARAIGLEVIDPFAGVDGDGCRWEGQGDVAHFDGVTLLFFGGRTDAEGVARARAHFDGELSLLEIEEPAFHGNMAALPLPAANKLLVCPDVVVGDGVERLERRFGRERLLFVSEDEIRSYSTNGLPVGRSWLAPTVVPKRVKDLVVSFGIDLVELEMKELCEKAGGASRCLVCHGRGAASAVQIPAANRLAATREVIRGEPNDG